MATERPEQPATHIALDVVANRMKNGAPEGASFEVSRLTDDLFTDSFLGGGDPSKPTPSGHRGTLTSQLSGADILDSNGGVPHKCPIQVTFERNAGQGAGHRNNPATGQAETVSATLTFFKSATRPERKYCLFFSDASSDKAGYTFSFLLL